MMRLIQTPTLKRAAKRLHQQQKQALDEAVRAIAVNPTIGENKAGDLAGARVCKFKMNRRLTLLAYQFFELENVVKLLALGSHENFYRDMKR